MSWPGSSRRTARQRPEPIDDRWQAVPRSAGRGPGFGRRRIRLTPTRVTIVVAFGGSGLFLLYTVLVRDASPPLLSSGAGVLGIVFAALAVAGGINTYRAAVEGRSGLALAYALGGGVAGIISALCFALALVLALVWQSVGSS